MSQEEQPESTKREMAMLRAELALLRANLKKMEKENDALKIERSKFTMDRYELEEELKRKATLRMQDEMISLNQRKMFRPNSAGSETEGVPIKFILNRTISDADPGPGVHLEKFKFFRDFFFDDFFSIPDARALEVVESCLRLNPRQFLEAYSLFCCKRAVFVQFALPVFENNSYLQMKIEILENVPPAWTIELLDTSLKTFVTINKMKLLNFIRHMADKCPSILCRVLSQEEFTHLLTMRSQIGHMIVTSVATQRIPGFIDETNLHLVPKPLLEAMFGDEYVDLWDAYDPNTSSYEM